MCKTAGADGALAEQDITRRADLRAFGQLGYRFQPEPSSEDRDVFLKMTQGRSSVKSRKNYRQKNSILPSFRVKLCSRYPSDRKRMI